MNRRTFLAAAMAGALAPLARQRRMWGGDSRPKHPSVVFAFADQWRAQAVGYAGDASARTPVLDAMARSSLRFTTAVSTCPVCSPYRASLLTGRYPHTHGVFLNDVCLNNDAVSIAQAYRSAGYHTAYIGKWHIDGHGRSAFIPRERRQGFEFWRAMECTHDYNNSFYFGDENVKLKWDGYDAIAQTAEACRYIRQQARQGPFLLMLSWGPPHNPYHTAPAKYAAMYRPDDLVLRPNVPQTMAAAARRDLAGYYAHISALDWCMGELLRCLDDTGIADNTIVVFTSDHGDMLYSQGEQRKQRPYDESILVPMLLRWPARFPRAQRIDAPFGAPDIMPTLLSLCGVPVPRTVEGLDFSGHLDGGPAPNDGAALIACYAPFGEWTRQRGGREYRGLRTQRHTYVRTLEGPWMLFDNAEDPYQQRNLVDSADHAALRRDLDRQLDATLRRLGDDFQPAAHYIQKWKYKTDATGTVPYTN